MEKSPLRGTLSGKVDKAATAETKLRGTLAPREDSELVRGEAVLRGTLASRTEEITASEGRVLSEAEVPNVESLKNFIGRTFIQRDSGQKAVLARISENPFGTHKNVTVGLHREDGARVSLPHERFRTIITTEGETWRLLDD